MRNLERYIAVLATLTFLLLVTMAVFFGIRSMEANERRTQLLRTVVQEFEAHRCRNELLHRRLVADIEGAPRPQFDCPDPDHLPGFDR